jgi:glycosyltransferase involved in cell wall biosynthesis
VIELSVIIPVYNEAAVIGRTLEGLKRTLRPSHEILVVYDFDEDNTLPVVQEFIKNRDGIRLVKNCYGRGPVNALRTGFEAAQGRAIAVTMGDSSDDPETLNAMYALLQKCFDLVCGSRYMPGGSQVGGPRLKSLTSRLAGRSLRLLTGIPTADVTSAFKMYRRELLRNIAIKSDGGFEVSMEITVKAFLQGYRITEVPTTWRDRSGGESKFRMWKWLPKYLRWYAFALWEIARGGRKPQAHA